MTNCARLTAGTATHDMYSHCIFIAQIQHTEWPSNGSHMCLTLPEIALSISAIDSDAPIAIGKDAHTSYRCLAAPHTVVVITLVGISQRKLSSSLLCLSVFFQQCLRPRPNYWMLSLMWMVWTSIHFQVLHNLSTQTIVHYHTTHSTLNSTLWKFAFKHLTQRLLL